MNEMAGSLAIDTALVPALFARSRLRTADDFLQREVAQRMRERLANIRIDATQVLDLGCGAGGDFAWLRQRLPDATICGVDVSSARLIDVLGERRTGLARFLRRDIGPLRVAADFEALPFAARSFDLLWSNLALHWSAAPHRVLPEWARVARVGGLVAFSAFGPDTLREVGEAFAQVDRARHVMPFTDMHDYGDMLVASGFTTPVVDMERLTLTYSTIESLWSDVRALGGNAAIDRSRGLHGRDWGRRVADALAHGRDAAGRHRLTFELVFAHAWKGEPRTTSRGETIVRLERPR
ncbi:MAG: methyltransferase domain-containing protein [Burkholderiaceae bacterium]